VRDIPQVTVERQLHLSYETAYFKLTRLCASIHDWEVRNTNFRVVQGRLGLKVLTYPL